VYVRVDSIREWNALWKIVLDYGPMRFKRLSQRVYSIGVEGSKVCSLCCVQSNLVAPYNNSEPTEHTEVLK
jgi:hypothetical protein